MNVSLYENMKAGKMKTIALIAQKGGFLVGLHTSLLFFLLILSDN